MSGDITSDGVVMMFCQLDESCVPQHANERKVRTLEEDSIKGDTSTDVDNISVNNEEYDLEELEDPENKEEDLEENIDDDDDDDDDDNIDTDSTGQSEDIFSSAVPSADVGNSENVGSSSVPGNISEDTVNSAVATGHMRRSGEEISDEDAAESATTFDRSLVSDDVERLELNTASRNEPVSDVVEEFPDTSIELQHISGSKLVLFI